jgi:hypothetical protein
MKNVNEARDDRPATNAPPKISVAVLTYNRAAQVLETLARASSRVELYAVSTLSGTRVAMR